MAMSSALINFETVLDESSSPSVILDTELTILWCNAAYEKTIGKKKEDLVDQALYAVFPGRCPEQRAQLDESFSKVIMSGSAHRIPLSKFDLRKDLGGESEEFQDYYWSILNTPILNESGKTQFILNQPTDITELTELREELESAGANAAEKVTLSEVWERKYLHLVSSERKKLSELFQQAPGFMCILVGPNHIYEMANDAYFSLIGRKYFIGQSVAEVLPELEGQSFPGILDDVYNTGKPFVGKALPFEVKRLHHASSETLYIDFIYQPIFDASGEVFGIFVQGHDITEAYELSQKISYQAVHDSLTGLFNRRELNKQTAELESEDSAHMLLYMDLDHFKIVNDRCGHHAGDELLVQIAKSFDELLEGNGLLARIGGDEFVLILRNSTDSAALEVAQDILKQIENLMFFWEGKRYSLTISIGVAAFGGKANERFSEALSLADSACFLAKEKGRNRCQFASPDDDELHRQLHDMDWVNRLKEAMREDRVVLYGQHIKSFQGDKSMHRIEVLSRIVEENGDIVSPGMFIPAAERFGLIDHLDRHIIAKVFEKLAVLDATDEQPTRFFVNVSGITLSDPEFRYYMASLSNRYPQVKPEHICFEVTETAAVSNLGSTAEMMQQLNNLGFSFALDDFGSGVATFTYLESLPIQYVKIDGEFVTGFLTHPVSEAIVKSINNIAAVMDIETIAECVEDPAIIPHLKEIGINFGQGYGIHRPEPI